MNFPSRPLPCRPALLAALCLLAGPLAWAQAEHGRGDASDLSRAGAAPASRFAPGQDDNFDTEYVDIYQRFFSIAKGPDGRGVYETRRARAIYQTFPVIKGPRTKRIFIIGGSVAGELGGPQLKDVFLGAFPATDPQDIEIINCGMGGYDSYRDSLVEQEVLDYYQPDLIVALSGNDELNHNPIRLNLTLYRLDRLLSESAAYRWLKQRLQAPRRPALPGPRLPIFEENLRRMARAAARRGVPFVLCTLPGNVRDMPGQGLPEQQDWQDPAYAEAWVFLDFKEYARAAGLFGEYAARHPGTPYGHFYRAKALDKAGDLASAARFYKASMEYNAVACGPVRNRMIRVVCSEEDGCILADLEGAFARVAPQGLPGGDFFMDSMHWYWQHDDFVFAAVLDAVRRHDVSTPSNAFLPAAQWQEAGPLSSLAARRTDWSQLTEHDNPLWFSVREILGDPAGARDEPSIAMFQAAYRLHPAFLVDLLKEQGLARAVLSGSVWTRGAQEQLGAAWPRVLEHAGEALRREGDVRDARRFLDEAIRLDPGLAWAYLFRALAEASSGERAKAASDLEVLERRAARWPDVRLFPGLVRERLAGKSGVSKTRKAL